ncbi:MAG: hypothetical protein C4583_11550 [Anaerolineaceae bacterium]|nr:MAG: hypothetical protein C4583_11550 [Anaerolineaceae bacterium]
MGTNDSVDLNSRDKNANTPSSKIVDWTISEWKKSKHLAKRFLYYLAAWIVSAIFLCYGSALALSFIDETLNLIKTFRQYTLLILLVPLLLLFLLNKLLPILIRLAAKADVSNKTVSLTDDKAD